MATKKVATKKKSVKKPTAKRASKKAEAIAKVNAFKHKRVVLESIGNESFPEMVLISAGPIWAKSIVGKRYVSADRAIAIIETLDAEKNIAKGAKGIIKEMEAAGITPLSIDNEVVTEGE